MKNTSTKKVLICLSILFLLGTFIVSAISIDPGRFVATMRIQQINLYYRLSSTSEDGEKNDIIKAGMTNYLGINKGSLYIRPVDYSGNLVDETNNVVTNPDYASIIGGQMNTNNGDETTLILGGSKNTVGGHGVVLMGGDANTATVDNAVILGSANSTVGSTNGVIMASYGGKVYGNNSTIFGGGGNIHTGSDNSFAIGGGVNLVHQGIFAYGGGTSTKPNIAQFNGGQGIIVGWQKPNGNGRIKLSVNGALAVGRGICNDVMRGSIYYKPGRARDGKPAYCLCACVDNDGGAKAIALSNQPYCNSLCECQSENPDDCFLGMPQCGTRGLSGVALDYPNGSKGWGVASKFCEDNRSPKAYYFMNSGSAVRITGHVCEYSSSECNPPFPTPGQTVKWICAGVGYNDKVECLARRGVEYPELAECGPNAKRYKFSDSEFTGKNESDFCKYLTDNQNDRSRNGELKGYKVLNREQVKAEFKSGIVYPFETGGNILEQLLNPHSFPKENGRTYWLCETTNAASEIAGQETVNTTQCYAERVRCNHCSKDGFPYCFDVDFSAECTCTDSNGCPPPCIPGSDNAGAYEIHVAWNDTHTSDSLKTTITKIESLTPGLTASIGEGKANYDFPVNSGDEKKSYTAKLTASGSVEYCPYWTTTISQCPKGQSWDSVHSECVADRCTGALKAGAVLPPENEKDLETSVEIILTGADIADSHTVKCASRCAKNTETYKDSSGKTQTADRDLTLLYRGGNPNDPFCARCKSGSAIPEAGWCEFMDPADCKDPYKWFKKDEGVCALPGTCQGIVEEAMQQKYDDIIPIADKYGTPQNGHCVSSKVLADSMPNQCIYSCKDPYICSEGSCRLPACSYRSSNSGQWLIDNIRKGEQYYDAYINNMPNREEILENNKLYQYYYAPYYPDTGKNRFRGLNPELQKDITKASFYYDVYRTGTITIQNPSIVGEPWVFVAAETKEEFNKKVKGRNGNERTLNGCFYWCTGTDFRMDILDGGEIAYSCGVDPRKEEGTPGYTGWVGTVSTTKYKNLCKGSIRYKGKYSYSFEYGDEEDYEDWNVDEHPWQFSESGPKSDPCWFWCADDYTHVNTGGQDYCWRQCDVTKEYAVNAVCYTCPSGTYPTTGDRDVFGNPKGCWSKCNKHERISNNGYCYPCGSGKKGDPNDLDSHGNSKSCVDICDDGETYWTNRDGFQDCGTKNGVAVPNCCLSTYAQANYGKCDQKDEHGNKVHTECEKVGSNCVCYEDMAGV